MSTARHQQTNGLGEQVVRRVKDCFRAIGRPKNWRNDLAAIAFALNSAIHSSTGFTPNSLVYGYSPEDINPFQPFASDLDLLHDAIQNALARVGRTEITYNKHAQAHEGLQVCDYVLVDRTGLNWPEDQNKPSLLLPPKIGPFRIVAKHPNENYELVLPNSWKVHPIFAREKIFEYRETDTPTEKDLQESPNPDPQEEYEVEKILDIDLDDNHNLTVSIKWVEFENPTWQPIKDLVNAQDKLQEFFDTSGNTLGLSLETLFPPENTTDLATDLNQIDLDATATNDASWLSYHSARGSVVGNNPSPNPPTKPRATGSITPTSSH